MIERLIAIGTAALILTSASVASAASFKARLTTEQEVPPVVVDEGTSGKFEIEFNRNFTEGEYKLQVKSGVRVTQAHLHCGAAGATGPIIIWLAGFHDKGWDVDGTWVANATVTNANITNTTCGATLQDIADSMNAGRVYVNVHSLGNAPGTARGQIESNLH
jgi:hypothetical protein